MRALGFTLFVVALVALASQSSARAQWDTVVVSPSTLEILEASQTKSRMAQLERAYGRVNLRRPRFGVGVSTVGLAGGAGIIAGSEILRSLFPRDDGTANGATTVGSLMVVGSAIGLVVASRRLKKKKAERRRLRWQMQSLSAAAPMTRP